MELTKEHIALSVACMLVGVLIGASFRSCSPKSNPEGQTLRIHDTIRVSDTVRIIEHTKPKNIVRTDTVFLYMIEDTLYDTVRVEVPIMQYEYRDTFATDTSRIELGVLYEGYNAKINDIDLNYTFDVKPRTIEKKAGWRQFIGLGVGAGYGASVVGGRVYAAPEVGVHIVYGFGYTWRK